LVVAQVLVGLLLGLAWWRLAPRPEAYWIGTTWYAPDDAGFGAAQDVQFAALTLVPGVAVGVCLAAWSGRPRPLVRLGLALMGACLGSGAVWLVGAGLSGGLGGAPETTGVAVTAPVTLSSPGVVLLWPVLATLVPALILSIRALFTDRP
jgi:hypothetical protein